MSRIDEIRELTRVRVLTFLREPEAIFWVFVFPLVLAAVLGFAFRSGGIEPSLIAIVESGFLISCARPPARRARTASRSRCVRSFGGPSVLDSSMRCLGPAQRPDRLPARRYRPP